MRATHETHPHTAFNLMLAVINRLQASVPGAELVTLRAGTERVVQYVKGGTRNGAMEYFRAVVLPAADGRRWALAPGNAIGVTDEYEYTGDVAFVPVPVPAAARTVSDEVARGLMMRGGGAPADLLYVDGVGRIYLHDRHEQSLSFGEVAILHLRTLEADVSERDAPEPRYRYPDSAVPGLVNAFRQTLGLPPL